MKTHRLVSKKHAQRLQSIWGKLKIPDGDSFIKTKVWKKLLDEATPKDLGHYAFSLLLTVGLSNSGGIELEPFEPVGAESNPNHNLILYTSSEVLSLKKAEFSADQLVEILKHIEWLPSHHCSQLSYGWIVVGALKPHFNANRKVTPELVQRIRQLRKNMSHVDAGFEKYVALIEKLLGDDQVDGPILWRSDAWMTTYCDLADDFDDEEKADWDEVMKVAFAAKGAKPSKKYLKSIAAAIDELGRTEFVKVMSDILHSIGEEGPMIQFGFMGLMDSDQTRLDRDFTSLLRALVWATAGVRKLSGALGHAAIECYQPLPNTGGRCTKVGAACLRSLVAIGDKPALKLIQQVRESAETKSIKQKIDRALEK